MEMENTIKSSNLEKNKKCKKICTEQLEKHPENKLNICSNKGQTYESACHQVCDIYFLDRTITAKYYAKCR